MKMKRILTAVALFMAVLTVGSSAWGMSYTDHVSVAANGKGDVLIFPIFVSADGWSNRVTVINTSGFSVVAKVVVRSAVFSQELLDFIVYLSPYDMWYGFIQYTANVPHMYSTDSSALYDSGIYIFDIEAPFATETNPMNQPFVKSNCAQDLNTLGYIEVIEAWSGAVAFTIEEKADKQLRGKKIAEAYKAAPYPGIVTRNVLTGTIDIDVETQGMNMTTSTKAVALKDYDNLIELSPLFNTPLGADARNVVREIDAALSKNNIAMPFINNTEGASLHLFTFPTKMSTSTNACVYANSRSDYFPLSQSVPYSLSVYDNDERKAENPFSPSKNYSLPNEFNFIELSKIVFKQGWIEYVLNNPRVYDGVNASGQVLRYTGAPVIPFVLDFRAGFSLSNGAYDDGEVSGTVDGTPTGAKLPLPNYQYSAAYSVS